ncbi:hypothetical protein [Parablautia sp. Marseille-Q6255]|uniref:hypothetical protein n=1 Tax=Parablautia sp. Marseille-Q6255 TaxID=3039593 RepID=UPI0024BC6F0A|nr:hypothetical protein [Parablautia sp. Marseille-Q6255]
MANERAFMYRNTAQTGEPPVWEKWFSKTVADAVLMSDSEGESKTIVDFVNEKIKDLIGTAPETYDTLQEIAQYIEEHKEVADALNEAITKKANADDILYKNQTPSTVAVGGIPKGFVPPETGVQAVEMINKMLHAYVSPSVTASAVPKNGGTFEIGTSEQVTAVTVNITMGSAAITKIEVLDGSEVIGSLTSGIKGGANTVTLAEPLTVTANKQLSVKVTDSDNKSVTAKTGTFTYVSPYYYGAIAAGATATEEIIKAATKSVTAKGNKTFTFTCNNQRMLFAYPKSYGNLAKILDANSFDVTGTFTKTEVTVGDVVYYAYVNDPSTVASFKMTFNY